MRQIEVINLETIIDVTAETSNVEILVRDYDAELVERFALEAQEAAIDAEESSDIATAQASIATAQATIATTQAGIATTQAGIATTQSQIATTKANEASASAASALASEQAADADRIAAQAAASTATTQAGIATTQAGIATTKAGEASDSAAAALASETDAETAASTATTQAGIATTQAGIATTQAGIATTQAGNALTSANNADASAAAAAQVGTSTPLTGFSTGANSTILATDTILQGFNKTQGQINARVSGTIATGQVAFGTAANTVGGDASLIWDNTNKTLDVRRADRALGAELRITNSFNGSGWIPNDIVGTLNFVSTDTSITQPIRSQIQAISSSTGNAPFAMNLTFSTASVDTLTERWRITSTGILQSNGAQTIQTSTGNLTLATAAGNGNILLTPNGTGNVRSNRNIYVDGALSIGGINGGATFFTSNDLNGTRSLSGSFGAQRYSMNVGLNAHIWSNAVSDIQGSAITYIERMRLADTGNLLLNTATDAGFKLDVNGTARVQGVLTTTADAVVNGVNVGRGGGSISSNTRVGAGALGVNTTGLNNTANGTNSLQNNTIGNSNSAYGVQSLLNNISGSGNISVGRDSGRFIADGTTALTIIGNSVFLGVDSRAAADNQTNQIVIGHTAIGLGSNTTVIGNSSTTFGRWFGNLLVGTSTNAGFALDVNGTARVQGSVANALTVQRTTATSNIYIRYQNSTNSWYAGQTDTGSFGIGTDAALGGGTLFNLTTGGNLLLGTVTNAASSILTMQSTTQGFLPPRMTTTQRNAIASPATGLVVYDTTLNKLAVYTGATWETVTSL
jgi:hypothetical protein